MTGGVGGRTLPGVRDPLIILIVVLAKTCGGDDLPPVARHPVPVPDAGAGQGGAGGSSGTSTASSSTGGGQGGLGGAGGAVVTSTSSGGGGQGGAMAATSSSSSGTGGCLNCMEALAVGVDGPGDDRLCPTAPGDPVGTKEAVSAINQVACSNICFQECELSFCAQLPIAPACESCVKDNSAALETCMKH